MKRSMLVLSIFVALFASQVPVFAEASATPSRQIDQDLEALEQARADQDAADYKLANLAYLQAREDLMQACRIGKSIPFKDAQLAVIDLLHSVSKLSEFSNDPTEIKSAAKFISELNFEVQSMGPWGRPDWPTHFLTVCKSIK